ncbi:unnamed protein product [Protopolystoma xenopodis]|uniref:Uncharacterized protein n=1 Tax=Protopolystoma xenopodis TaxID=117903 RepID=A0A3S5CNE1_9PLAT|nr:unnamed protein product [Protopolystoma xenopodis]
MPSISGFLALFEGQKVPTFGQRTKVLRIEWENWVGFIRGSRGVASATMIERNIALHCLQQSDFTSPTIEVHSPYSLTVIYVYARMYERCCVCPVPKLILKSG